MVTPSEILRLHASNMPIQAPFQFVNGLVNGLVGLNDLEEIQKCSTDATVVVNDVEKVVMDLIHNDYLELVTDLKKVIPDLMASLSDCESMTDELDAIEDWASIFTDHTALVETLTKNLLLHNKHIMADVSAISNDWQLGMYYKAGMDSADFLTTAIGPIQVQSEDQYQLPIELTDIPAFIQGFLYTFIDMNDLPEIDECYVSTQPLIPYVDAFIKDIMDMKIFDAIA